MAGTQITGIEPQRGSAEYHFATRRGGFARRTFDGSDLTTRGEDFDCAMSGIVAGMRTGTFHMDPAGDEKGCRYCEFDGLCPTSRWSEIARKADDPRARTFREIREVE
jgi:hypothetical protein